MARIQLLELAHSYDPDTGGPRSWAIEPLSLTWDDGGAYALLGPSGCGKTTLLNVISGICRPTRGAVLFDDRDVTALPPEARNIAQVFQFPVVYDTMTVFDNLAFPLRNRGWEAGRIRSRVHEIAELLELTPELAERARGLSADAKQKISLGRGLVRPDVSAVLFDEPLTVIDPQLKWLLRRKLKQVHEQLRLTFIYVTHDQTEALTFADSVVVMSRGEVAQRGSPEELFEAPASRFVGNFIGAPGMNFVACEWTDGQARVAGVPLRTCSAMEPAGDATLAIGIRPEYVRMQAAAGPNCLPARLVSARDEGAHTMLEVRIGDQTLWAKVPGREAAPMAQHAFVHLPAERCALYVDGRRAP